MPECPIYTFVVQTCDQEAAALQLLREAASFGADGKDSV